MRILLLILLLASCTEQDPKPKAPTEQPPGDPTGDPDAKNP